MISGKARRKLVSLIREAERASPLPGGRNSVYGRMRAALDEDMLPFDSARDMIHAVARGGMSRFEARHPGLAARIGGYRIKWAKGTNSCYIEILSKDAPGPRFIIGEVRLSDHRSLAATRDKKPTVRVRPGHEDGDGALIHQWTFWGAIGDVAAKIARAVRAAPDLPGGPDPSNWRERGAAARGSRLSITAEGDAVTLHILPEEGMAVIPCTAGPDELLAFMDGYFNGVEKADGG